MRIFEVDFEPVYGVPSGLIIAAPSLSEAKKIAKKTLIHTNARSIKEVNIEKPCVIFYESGDY